ncbi:MAG: hypothetical protein M3Y20_03070 [Actinomycetota bacterium]|nr:hypothetical protein [Actinomycetota bacterium]
MSDAATTARRSSTRRGMVSAAAALLLVASAAATPAQGAAAQAFPTGGEPSGLSIPDRPGRETAQVVPEAPLGGPQGAVRLDATATTRGATTTARTPQVLKREARLWMNRSVDYWPEPEQEVGSVTVVQDVKAKKVTASVTYDATPTAALNSLLWVYLGTWKDSSQETCTGKVWVVAMGHGTSADADFRSSAGSVGSATRSLSGSTLSVTASGAPAAVQTYDCAFAFLDGIVGAGETTELWNSGADHFKPEMEKAPEFDFYSSALNAAYPGKWNKIYINVDNEGDLTAKNVKLKLSGKKMTFKDKTIKVGTLKAGKDKKVYARVKLKGKKTQKLKITVTASGGWTAKTSTKVGYRPNPSKVKSLVGKSYWAAPYEMNTGWNVHGLTFVNKSWVYQGVPPKGTPKCSSKVKKCKKYSYSAATGKLKIGKMQAKVNSEGIRVTKVAKKGDKKLVFSPLKSPKKNSRIKAKLTYNDFNGCGVTFSCSTWTQHLTLAKNGKFSWTYSAIHSSGIPPYQTFVSVTRPTKQGTYKILSKSRIQFTYVDAETGKTTKETHTIGIDSNELGKHSPKYGLLIGAKPHS